MPALSNRVISIYNRRTSIRFTPAEWDALDDICKQEQIPRKTLIELIDINKDEKIGLAAAIRLFTIIYYKNAVLLKPETQKTDKDTFTSPIFDAIKEII